MVFQQFRTTFYDSVCFTPDQVYTLYPGFDKNNLGRWVRKGYLVRLRSGWYSFPEYLGKPDIARYLANRIYRPSYISLHTALAFYGIIPESVVQVTSVTSLKTMIFTNPFGTYTYQTVNPRLLFGYETKPIGDGRSLLMASPEKAIIDLLYLNPQYNTEEQLNELRLDVDFMVESVNTALLRDYAARLNQRTLLNRVEKLINLFSL
jgi:predicted transcriptional regulator of viral defense system